MKNKSTLYSRYFTYIKPISKLPIIKNYGPTIFTLLTISILTIFAIRPTVETILVLQKKLADEEEILQKVTDKVNNLSLGQRNYDNLDQNIKEKISQAIPDAISLKSVVQSLEEAARLHEASISALQIQPLEVSPRNEGSVGSVAEISFIFNTTGEYTKLISLLQDLKSNDRLIQIDNLSLSALTEGEGLIMS
ncbi:MAG: hypothetical protein UT54_C0053G0001, partial [Candidatus Daviesbacteria bacterium GW2011_GWB1_39_5]